MASCKRDSFPWRRGCHREKRAAEKEQSFHITHRMSLLWMLINTCVRRLPDAEKNTTGKT